MRPGLALLGTATAAFVLALAAPDAHACGGCFAPPPAPGQQVSIVTDHKMVLSVSKGQSTLYDEIEYQGAPESFGWVLPIAGTAEVGLSSDTVFRTLDTLTTTSVLAPPTRCPPPPSCPHDDRQYGAAKDSAGGFADAAAAPPVDVLKRETVGPYETVQLHSTDANALGEWLSTNGYEIPADIQPVIAAYVAESFDFLALKLVPGEGVTAMRPVRVTTQGASAVLPLRMVAAGTGATVGITLWVVGEGRYEPQNFPSFSIVSDDLTWDWGAGTSDYKQIRADRAAALGGRGWEVESSIALNRYQFEQYVQNAAGMGPGPSNGPDYLPETYDNGTVKKTAEQVRDEDLETLFAGIASGQERVTRLRSDVSHQALDQDLVMVASADQSLLANVRQPIKEKGQPICAVYDGCDYVGSAPRDEAIAQTEANTAANGESFSCRTATPTSHASGFAALGTFAALLGLGLSRARRKTDNDCDGK